MSSRTPLGSVTMEDSSHGFNESRSVMTKDNLKLLDLSTADNFCENRGRESEYAASLADECEESLEQTRSMVRARTNHVRKQTVNNSIKKKPQRKRRRFFKPSMLNILPAIMGSCGISHFVVIFHKGRAS